MLLRIIVIALILGIVYLGVRRIWRDWKKHFRAEDQAVHQRDLEERKRPDVVTLKRDKDGTYRRSDDDGRS